MKNEKVVMNKRYSLGAIILFSIFFLLIFTSYDEKYVPVALFIMVILIIFSIILLKLPKCKAFEIVDDNIIIYSYGKKSEHKIKYNIKIKDVDRYYLTTVGGMKSGVQALIICVEKKRITLKSFGFNFRNEGLINYNVRKIKKLIDLEKNLKENK